MTTKKKIKSCEDLKLIPLNLYRDVFPDPKIHGSGPFVASLPAKDRVSSDHYTTASQYPIWHPDCTYVGSLFETDSIFKKQRKGGCISLIYEQQLRQRGIHGYSFTILSGNISAADGVGFAFGSRVPCSKNIKRLWSVFVSRTGKITKCMGGKLIHKDTPELPPFNVGQVLSMILDLNLYRATFEMRNTYEVLARSHVDLSDIAEKVDASSGYLCAAVAKAGIVARLLPASTSIMNLPEIKYKPSKPYHSPSKKYKNKTTPWPYNISAPEFYPNIHLSQRSIPMDSLGLTPDSAKHTNTSNDNSCLFEPLPLLRSSPINYPDEIDLPNIKQSYDYINYFSNPGLLDDIITPINKSTTDQPNDSFYKLCDSWLTNEQSASQQLDNNLPLLTHETRTESALTPSDALKLIQKIQKINPDLLLSFSNFDYLTEGKKQDDQKIKTPLQLDDDFNLLLESNRTLSAPSGTG